MLIMFFADTCMKFEITLSQWDMNLINDMGILLKRIYGVMS